MSFALEEGSGCATAYHQDGCGADWACHLWWGIYQWTLAKIQQSSAFSFSIALSIFQMLSSHCGWCLWCWIAPNLFIRTVGIPGNVRMKQNCRKFCCTALPCTHEVATSLRGLAAPKKERGGAARSHYSNTHQPLYPPNQEAFSLFSWIFFTHNWY